MSIKPILFNTEMVRAILEGRKTVTRRVMKPQTYTECDHGGTHEFVTDDFGFKSQYTGFVCRKCGYGVTPLRGTSFFRPPYNSGDILYVRETWVMLWYVDPDGYTHYDQPMYYFAADGTPDITLVDGDGFELGDQRIRWHPSIHMPKEVARLFLRVKNVRAERLQDIDEEGAKAEGANYQEGNMLALKKKCGVLLLRVLQRFGTERFNQKTSAYTAGMPTRGSG